MSEKVEGWHWPVFGGLGDTLCGIKRAYYNITLSKTRLNCEACKAELQKLIKEKKRGYK